MSYILDHDFLSKLIILLDKDTLLSFCHANKYLYFNIIFIIVSQKDCINRACIVQLLRTHFISCILNGKDINNKALCKIYCAHVLFDKNKNSICQKEFNALSLKYKNIIKNYWHHKNSLYGILCDTDTMNTINIIEYFVVKEELPITRSKRITQRIKICNEISECEKENNMHHVYVEQVKNGGYGGHWNGEHKLILEQLYTFRQIPYVNKNFEKMTNIMWDITNHFVESFDNIDKSIDDNRIDNKKQFINDYLNHLKQLINKCEYEYEY